MISLVVKIGRECWSENEFGSRTRRRPIRQDYAAAKDAASGLSEL
jgi:hypothetical protein